MKNKVYIYGLCNDNGIIRYVGQSYRPIIRKNDHLSEARRGVITHKNNWIRKSLRNGDNINVIILEECDNDNWIHREQYWIKELPNLTNHTEGGEGKTGSIYDISLEEIKKWVKINIPHVNSETKWRQYIKNNTLPNYIPKRPDSVLKNKGWISWGEFFGTNNKKVEKYKLTYFNLRSIAHTQKLKSIRCWYKYARDNNLPVIPELTFKYKGWISWSNFLGPTYKRVKGEIFYDYIKSKEIIKKYKFKTSLEFRSKIRDNPIKGIPKNPSSFFRKRGVWNGWRDYLSL